jgi:hypothetical protein
LCVFGFIAAVAHEAWPRRAEVVADVAAVFASPEPADAALARTSAAERPTYRHSIVPGGVYSSGEVAEAVRNDEVVAAHYKDVDLSTLHSKSVPAARAVYVSYRIGDRVFWTKNRVRLASGETVLTDGHTEIRARCGNLVSDRAQQPVADREPAPAALDETQPDTGSSTIAGARGPDGGLDDIPSLPMLASGIPFGSGGEASPGVSGAPGPPMSIGGGGSPGLRSKTGGGGEADGAPLGNSDRTNRGANGGGSNDNGHPSNGGGPGIGGPSGGGPNGDGPHDGGPHDGGPHGDEGGPEAPTGGGDTGTGGGTDTGDVTDTTGSSDISADVPNVPEPGTMALLTLGAIAAAARTLRARR